MLTVGLHDNTWRGDACSIRWATPQHLKYERDVMKFDGPVLFTDGFTLDAEAPTRDNVESPIRIGWLHEPPCLIPTVYAAAPDNLKHFNGGMFTYHAELLKLPGFRFCPYGGIWLDRSDWGMRPKRHICSMLIGSKMATEGHRIRHDIAELVKGRGVQFYGVKGINVGYERDAKIRVLGDYAFSIVCEACNSDNLYTEILLDAFACGTIPIFWGAGNIGQYFDTRGMLCFQTPLECLNIVQGLSFNQYISMMPYAIENLNRALEYAVTDDWLYDHYLKEYDH